MSVPTKRRRTIAALATAFTLMSGSMLVGAPATGAPEAASVTAASTCYGGQKYFSAEVGYHPTGSGRLTATSNCNDINVKFTNNMITPSRKVRVCFYPSSGSSYCQSNYTTISGSQWKVVATNVKSGTKFRLQFPSGNGLSQGYWAG